MRIALFGGTRGTGRLVMMQALEAGWGVKALARNPEAMPPEAGVEVIAGDALDPGAVIRTITGCDAVVSCLGPALKSKQDRASRGTVCTQFTRSLLPAMEKFSISRLVVVSTLGVGETKHQIPLLMRPVFATIMRSMITDREGQEALIRQSSLDWTIIRPGGLTDTTQPHAPRIGTDTETTAGAISRDAVASFIIQEVKDGTYRHQTPYIT